MDEKFGNLKGIIEVEDSLFNISKDTFEDTLALINEFFRSNSENLELTKLILYIIDKKPFNIIIYAKLYNVLELSTDIILENSIFQPYFDYFFNQRIAKNDENKVNSSPQKTKKRTKKLVLKYFEKNSAAYSIQKDDLSQILFLSSDPNFAKQIIVFREETYDILSFAALCGSFKVFKHLIQNDFPITRQTIESSIKSNNSNIIELLLQKEQKFDNCLDVAISYHSNNLLEMLYSSFTQQKYDISDCWKNHNHFSFVFLIDKGYDIEQKNSSLRTPLMESSFYNSCLTLQYLIDINAKIDAETEISQTALSFAIEKQNEECAKLLIEKGANIEIKSIEGYTSLILAVKMNLYDTVDLLLSKNANVNAKDNNSQTSLHHAVINNNLEVVQLLLQHNNSQNIDVNTQDYSGMTPLMYASENNNVKIAKFLLIYKANINDKNHRGDTPLIIACRNCNKEMVSFLISNKATKNIENYEGETAKKVTQDETILELLK